MPKTIHVTVTYSVHIEDEISDKDAKIHAMNNYESEGKVFDCKAVVFDKWKNQVKPSKRGIGSY